MTVVRKIKCAMPCVMLLGALILGGCAQDDETDIDNGRTPVAFSAGIEGASGHASIAERGDNGAAPATRTTGGDAWIATDRVGVFMLTTGGNITTSAHVLADNREYSVTPATGALSPTDGTPIYYPGSGAVDFVAYYPYGTVTNGTYSLTVAGQTSEAAQNGLDVIYVRNDNSGTGYTKTQTAVGLTFNHVLSKVTINVTLGDGLTGLSGDDITAVTLTGMPQTATLSLQNGTLTAGVAGDFSALKAETASGNANATFSALLIPQPTANTYTGRTAVFTVNGTDYTWNIPNNVVFTKGKNHTYSITVKLNGITVGTPTITDWNQSDKGTGDMQEIGKGIEKVYIPAGTFMMGEEGGNDNPPRKVTLTKDFYMSKYEVTNTQYAAFLNANNIADDGMGYVTYYEDNFTTPVTKTQRFIGSDSWGVTYADGDGAWKAKVNYESHPVINVTWYGAKAYADWVGGSLPTEAQWEYACRGGTETAFYFGDAAADMGNYGWSWENNNPNGTKAVGQKLPNDYGLYDMHGNVFEWCSDWYGAYGSGPDTDPTGPPTGSFRVLRGGSWIFNAQYCRSAFRYSNIPDYAFNNVGFRVVFFP